MRCKWNAIRNLAAFWLLGICTDFAYIIMLSGAEDIISANDVNPQNTTKDSDKCEEKLTSRHCASISTGAVLIADILPVLFLKTTIPFYMHRVPIGIRHILVVIIQMMAYIVVAFAVNITMSLSGVVLASLSSGLGEVSYLALAAFFEKNTISTWSSGTGGASLFGSLSYAALTEPHMLNLSPKHALLTMLFIPVVLACTYQFLLKIPRGVYRIKVYDPRTWMVPQQYYDDQLSASCDTKLQFDEDESKQMPPPLGPPAGPSKAKLSTDDVHQLSIENIDRAIQNVGKLEQGKKAKDEKNAIDIVPQRQLSFYEKLRLAVPLLKFMIPLTSVYFGEYAINQGMVELIIFDCSHSFNLSRASQYRWYQLLNAVFFFLDSLYFFVPHIGIMFALILFEGFFGGSSYVNTFRSVYEHAEPDVREYSLSMAMLADTVGVVVAGFLAIPIHNYVCRQPLP